MQKACESLHVDGHLARLIGEAEWEYVIPGDTCRKDVFGIL